MTWKQIRSAAEKQGLSCSQVYKLVVAQKPTTNCASDAIALAEQYRSSHDKRGEWITMGEFIEWLQQQSV